MCSCKNHSDAPVFVVTPVSNERKAEISELLSDYLGLRSEYKIRGPLTFAEAEEEQIKEFEEIKKKIPEFAKFINKNKNKNKWDPRWEEFKGKYKSGDEPYFFTSDELNWGGLSGREGYVIVREKKIVDITITKMN